MPRGNDILTAYQERIRAEKDAQTLTQYCQWCDWTITDVLSVTRTAFAAHQKAEHPEHKQKTSFARRRKYTIRTVTSRSLDENIALTRQQGGATWATEEQ